MLLIFVFMFSFVEIENNRTFFPKLIFATDIYLAKCYNIHFQFCIANAEIHYNLSIETFVDPSQQNQ